MSSFCAPSFDSAPSVGRSYSRSYNFPQVNPLDPEAFMSTRVELCLLCFD